MTTPSRQGFGFYVLSPFSQEKNNSWLPDEGMKDFVAGEANMPN